MWDIKPSVVNQSQTPKANFYIASPFAIFLLNFSALNTCSRIQFQFIRKCENWKRFLRSKISIHFLLIQQSFYNCCWAKKKIDEAVFSPKKLSIILKWEILHRVFSGLNDSKMLAYHSTKKACQVILIENVFLETGDSTLFVAPIKCELFGHLIKLKFAFGYSINENFRVVSSVTFRFHLRLMVTQRIFFFLS